MFYGKSSRKLRLSDRQERLALLKYPLASSQLKKRGGGREYIVVSRFLRNIKLELRGQEIQRTFIASDVLKNT